MEAEKRWLAQCFVHDRHESWIGDFPDSQFSMFRTTLLQPVRTLWNLLSVCIVQGFLEHTGTWHNTLPLCAPTMSHWCIWQVHRLHICATTGIKPAHFKIWSCESYTCSQVFHNSAHSPRSQAVHMEGHLPQTIVYSSPFPCPKSLWWTIAAPEK